MNESWSTTNIKNNMAYEEDNEPAAMEAELYEDGRISNRQEIHGNNSQPDNCWNRFKRGIRGLWATKHTEDTENDPDLYAKTTIRELVVYICFIVVLMIVALGMASVSKYYYQNVLQNLFLTQSFADTSASYSTGTTITDFWKFLQGPLISGLYWTQWYNNNPVDPSMVNFLFYESKLIGVPRIRQVRVGSNSCVVPADFQSAISQCFAPYSLSTESQDSFGLQNSTAWNYTAESVLKMGTAYGNIAQYSGGGFYVDLGSTADNANSIINMLMQNLWIDRGTRAVFVDFTVYNANVNLFCVIRIIAEFPATGGMMPTQTFRVVKLIRYVTPMDYFVLANEILFVLFIVYYIVEETIEIKKIGFEYFLGFWNCLDILVILISFVCIIFNVYRTLKVNTMLTQMLQQQDQFANFDFLSYWELQFNYAIAITVFLAWIKIFKYISFNKTMTQLSMTLSKCAKDLVGFSVMFIIIFLAFAQLGYLIFGAQVQTFAQFHESIFTLFRILLGDFDFNSLEQAHRVLGPLYFILYIFFVFFVLLNMFLAIITDTYTDVKEELADAKNDFEVADFFRRRAHEMMIKLNIKRDKLIDIQNAIMAADSNKDQQVDFDEWRAELRTRGYADAEIEAVFAKYDKNNDRTLDSSEQESMQRELEGQKQALAREISRTEEIEESATNKNISVNAEEFSVLARRVDRMENNISAIVSKIEDVLLNLENIEKTKSKSRETMGMILNTLTSTDDLSEAERRKQLETLVHDEMNKLNEEASTFKSLR